MVGILNEIYKNFKETQEIILPNNSFLEDIELNKDSILAMESVEEFVEKFSIIMDTDIRLFIQILEKQGYDFYLQKVAYPTCLQQYQSSAKINMSLLQKLKAFIEQDMCNESKGIV